MVLITPSLGRCRESTSDQAADLAAAEPEAKPRAHQRGRFCGLEAEATAATLAATPGCGQAMHQLPRGYDASRSHQSRIPNPSAGPIKRDSDQHRGRPRHTEGAPFASETQHPLSTSLSHRLDGIGHHLVRCWRSRSTRPAPSTSSPWTTRSRIATYCGCFISLSDMAFVQASPRRHMMKSVDTETRMRFGEGRIGSRSSGGLRFRQRRLAL